jgi:hypothetical protein
MPPKASLRFVSLFVPDLEEAARTYTALLGMQPAAGPSPAPAPHPFAAAGPVVLERGGVALALYRGSRADRGASEHRAVERRSVRSVVAAARAGFGWRPSAVAAKTGRLKADESTQARLNAFRQMLNDTADALSPGISSATAWSDCPE